MKRFPFSLRLSIPAILLLFGMMLGLVNTQREASQSFQHVEEDSTINAKFAGDQISGMLEYLYRRGDTEQAEVAISKMRSDVNLKWSLLFDENNQVLLATQYQLRKRSITDTGLFHSKNRLQLFEAEPTTSLCLSHIVEA